MSHSGRSHNAAHNSPQSGTKTPPPPTSPLSMRNTVLSCSSQCSSAAYQSLFNLASATSTASQQEQPHPHWRPNSHHSDTAQPLHHYPHAFTHALSFIPFRIRLLSITLPRSLYNDPSNAQIYQKMGYYQNHSKSYFKLQTMLFLSREMTSLVQMLESYATVETQKYGGLSLEFGEWIQFNASLSDLTKDACVVFRLLEGSHDHSDEACHNHQPPLQLVERAYFCMNIFDRTTGLLRTDSQHVSYGRVKRRLEEHVPYKVQPSYDWLDKRSFPAINRRNERLTALSQREALIEDWLGDWDEHEAISRDKISTSQLLDTDESPRSPQSASSLSPQHHKQKERSAEQLSVHSEDTLTKAHAQKTSLGTTNQPDTAKSGGYTLYVRFHSYSCPVYYKQMSQRSSSSSSFRHNASKSSVGGASPAHHTVKRRARTRSAADETVVTWSISNKDRIMNTFYDDEENHNPCEHMYATRTLNNLHASDARPNRDELRKIEKIINYTILQPLSDSERILLWKYRYFLKGFEKKALVKFLESVQWESARSKNEALNLLKGWGAIDPEQCLVLLSDKFEIAEIRNYAVNLLKMKASDEDILRILLQLVQALRYEKKLPKCPLAKFLIARAQKSFPIANYLYWYLQVESRDEKFGPQYQYLCQRLMRKLEHNPFKKLLERQQLLVNELDSIARKLVGFSLIEAKKRLRKLLRESHNPDNPTWGRIFETPLPLPVSPSVSVESILEEKASVFSSNARPLKISFLTTKEEQYDLLFKLGDDLRQDQLVLQIVDFVDQVLRKNNLDLQLTPYNVLPTSLDSGFVELVPACETLFNLEKQKNIRDHLKEKNAGSYKMAFNHYFKSMCGYTVISFLLGFGDRHMENILLQDNGKLFHIDFGFILGDQPWKPLYAKYVKLTPYMLEGLGGANSSTYEEFLTHCGGCYGIIRRHAHVIVNMMYLMVDAGIEGISKKGKPRQKIMFVQNNFQLESDLAEAQQYVVNVIRSDAASYGGRFEDTTHKLAKMFHR